MSLSQGVGSLVSMELASTVDLTNPRSVDAAARGVCGAVGSVCVGGVDETGLPVEVLQKRVELVTRAESALAAIKARSLAELNRQQSKADTQEFLRNELLLSGREAKRETETASQLAELPETSHALASGKIRKSHADLIARASGESTVDEGLLAEAASEQPVDAFTRTVKRHQQDAASDDGQSLLDRQRKNRRARIFESSDSGMFVLSGEFDQITGTRIATALTAKERQLWHHENPKTRVTPQQRMADALTELICGTTNNNNTGGGDANSDDSNGDGGSGSRRSRSQGTDLLIIADFDALTQQLKNPRLADGSPIPLTELHRLALEANILPSIFDAKTQNMWLGRKQRCASDAQRVALIARDQRCVGCSANPLWCRAHHITYWSNDGPTDLDNLVLVCDRCHHKIHDDGWTVTQHPTTHKYILKPPDKPPNPTAQAKPDRDRESARGSTRPNPTTRNKPPDQRKASVRDPTRHELSQTPPTPRPRPQPQTRRALKPANAPPASAELPPGHTVKAATTPIKATATRNPSAIR